MGSTQVYAYDDLERPDSVRLLRLEPADDWYADLHGSLVCTRLSVFDDQVVHRYIALSYCWGDPTPADTVYLDDVRLGITENLGAALRDIRDDAQAQLIWADALSINQADIVERNWQVRLMGEIYRRAGTTIIHLGHLVEGSGVVYQAAVSARTQRMFQISGNQAPNAATDVDSGSLASGADDRMRSAISELCRCAWFSRGWVFQELLLSQDPRVQCGRSRIRWTTLMDYVRPFLSEGGLESSCLAMDKAFRLRTEWTFGQLVQSRFKTHVTDPRDYFFSLLGVASDAMDVMDIVKVDYSQSVRDVYIAAARCILRHVRLSELLKYNTHLSSLRQPLPSWVPDWGVLAGSAVRPEVPSGVASIVSDEPEGSLGDILVVRRTSELQTIEKLSGILPRPEDYPESTKRISMAQLNKFAISVHYTEEERLVRISIWQAFLDPVTDPVMPHASSQRLENDSKPESPCFAGTDEWAPQTTSSLRDTGLLIRHYYKGRSWWGPDAPHDSARHRVAKLGNGNFAVVTADARAGDAIVGLSHTEHKLRDYQIDGAATFPYVVRPVEQSPACMAGLHPSRLQAAAQRWKDVDESKLTHCSLRPESVLWPAKYELNSSSNTRAVGYVALH